jgi:sugar/nucleoside kinase (ribokinase family)
MTKRFDIAVVGELNADLVLRGNVVPEFHQVEKVLAEADLVLGSSSAIFACGAARLGLKVTFLSKVGSDPFGSFLLNELEQRGIDTKAIVVDKKSRTGLSVILNRGHDRAILTYPGSMADLSDKDLSLKTILSARHLHLGGFYLLDGLRRDVPQLFAFAKRNGLSTSLDTNYDPKGKWEGGIRRVLPKIDCFLPNETELCGIMKTRSLSKAMQNAATLVALVACKRGKQGARAVMGDVNTDVKSLRVKVVDTVGAGDSFDAGFLYGFLHEWTLERSVRLGCVCGALSTRKTGGTAGQPDLAEAIPYV